MKKIVFFWFCLTSAIVTLVPGRANAIPCSSAGGCSDCEHDENGVAQCKAVLRDAHCECSILANLRFSCILEETCDYTGGGGGGTGGGGGGGGGTGTCAQLPGNWCPPECSSCTTVYWN